LDRIVAVDSQPVERAKDVFMAVSGKRPGTPVQYVVESESQIREVTIPGDWRALL
jgi:hypothetical protein